jgi:hypothetical protein
MPEQSSTLLELARKKFAPHQLSLAEEELFRRAEIGEISSAVTEDEKQVDLTNAANWNADRVLLAECIAWLCTDREASALVTYRGIEVRSARIDGDLDLSHADVKFPMSVWKSVFIGNILLRDVELRELCLQACNIKNLWADRAKIAGTVFLRNGFKAEGEVRLLGATIGRSLDCEGGQLLNPNGKALSADGARIEGSALLRNGFKAQSRVDLVAATISARK